MRGFVCLVGGFISSLILGYFAGQVVVGGQTCGNAGSCYGAGYSGAAIFFLVMLVGTPLLTYLYYKMSLDMH